MKWLEMVDNMAWSRVDGCGGELHGIHVGTTISGYIKWQGKDLLIKYYFELD